MVKRIVKVYSPNGLFKIKQLLELLKVHHIFGFDNGFLPMTV
jgi:hypothetical protein